MAWYNFRTWELSYLGAETSFLNSRNSFHFLILKGNFSLYSQLLLCVSNLVSEHYLGRYCRHERHLTDGCHEKDVWVCQIWIVEEMSNLTWRFEQPIKIQEESVQIATSSTAKAKEVVILLGISLELRGSTMFTSLQRSYQIHKLKLPTYDGMNPDGWIMKVGWYFALN